MRYQPGTTAPRLPAWLLRFLAPGDSGDYVAGDLDEEYARYTVMSRGRLRADMWYWKQALLSIVALRVARRRRTVPPGVRRGGGGIMEGFVQDFRYAVRGLMGRPGFTVVAVLTLALGIGANTAVFSVVNGVVFKPLPYENGDEIVRLWPDRLFAFDKRFAVEMEDVSAFAETAMWGRRGWSIGEGASRLDIRGASVSDNHFSMLGVQPMLGRAFAPGESGVGAANVTVIGHALWVSAFGSDPTIVGTDVEFSSGPITVIGVLGPEHQPIEADWQMWIPIELDPGHWSRDNAVNVNARLRPGATFEQAQEEFRAVAAAFYLQEGWGEMEPEDRAAATLAPIKAWMIGDVRTRMIVLLASVGFILLIACVNVANLLLAAGGGRVREVAVRAALGATRGRLIRQFLTESVLLGLVGGVLGWIIAARALDFGLAHLPADIPRTGQIAVDARVLAVALLAGLAASAVFGIVPAVRTSSGRFSEALKEGARGQSTGGRALRLNHALVTAEVAVTVVLVVAATLMIRSFWTLVNVDPGFDPSGVVTLRVSPPADRYRSDDAVLAYHAELVQALSQTVGVTGVGGIQFMPMTSGGQYAEVRTEAALDADRYGTSYRVVTSEYLATMRIPVMSGRGFDTTDRAGATAVILVNQTLAREAWGDVDPVGRQLWGEDQTENPYTVVGVIGDVRQTELAETAMPEVYVPITQQVTRSMHYAVRVVGDPRGALPEIQRTVARIDGLVPISRVAVASDVVAGSVSSARFFTLLLGAFGALGLFLGAVGVYGVMAYTVSQRTQEIGIRLALGAGGPELLRRTVVRGLVPVALGIGIGVPIAFMTSRLLASALYEVTPADPMTYIVVPLILTAVSVLAIYLPARRASRIDPARVLRGE